jgi:hypothetical protein
MPYCARHEGPDFEGTHMSGLWGESVGGLLVQWFLPYPRAAVFLFFEKKKKQNL